MCYDKEVVVMKSIVMTLPSSVCKVFVYLVASVVISGVYSVCQLVP